MYSRIVYETEVFDSLYTSKVRFYMKNVFKVLTAAGLLVSLASCSSQQSQSTDGGETGSAGSDSLHFELPGGTLDYVGYEYVSPGFYLNEGDYTKTVCLNFDYTNNEDEAKSWYSDFWITAYQNGNELDGPSSYLADEQPETMKNNYDEVLKGGTLHFGQAYVLNDYSPVTVIAKHNGGKETSDQLVIEIEPYESNAFDIDRLYGVWKAGSASLTLTSSRITLSEGSSSTYKDDPKLWTDDTTLHTSLSDCKELRIEERNGELHLINDEYDFVQEENWSEASSSKGELNEVAFGETIATDFVELTFDEKDTVNELVNVYTSSGGGITIKNVIEQEKANTKYVYVKGTVKNISSGQYDPEEMKARFIVDGKYELEGKVSTIDGNGSDTINLDPLNSEVIYVSAGLDSAAAESAKSIELYLGFERSFSGSSNGDPKDSTYYYMIKLR